MKWYYKLSVWMVYSDAVKKFDITKSSMRYCYVFFMYQHLGIPKVSVQYTYESLHTEIFSKY